MLEFEHLYLRNWRNFGDISINIRDRMFIVGANASGKSNLLDVFRFLKDITNIGLQKAVDGRGGIKKLRNLNARGNNHIEVAVDLNDTSKEPAEVWSYKLQFNSTGGGNREVTIRLETIEKDGEVLLLRKYNSPDEDYLSRQFTHLEQPAMNTKYRALYECFKAISYVNIIPQLVREADSFIPSASDEDFYGRNLLESISATPERMRNSRLNAITKVLKLAVPQFSDLDFMKDEKGRPHLQVRYEHFRPHGAYQREDQFSDGTLRLIGIIWAILAGKSLLLLEEPELYLHSEIVKQLPLFIANAQTTRDGRRRQVIISSHSFDLLNTDTISPEEIAVLKAGKENTTIEMASEIEAVTKKLEAGFTPADAVIPQVTPRGIADGQLSILDII